MSTCKPEVRRGWNSFLENVLCHVDAYKGFFFLTAKDVPIGEKPGIIPNHDNPGLTEFPDETRRNYFPIIVPTAKVTQ
jgi:hypothetical protein